MKLICKDLLATTTLAQLLAQKITSPFNLSLNGDLGAGKTTFARAFLESLKVDPQSISSPTFTIVNEYLAPQLFINHIDLYRIDTYSQLDQIGYLEILTQADINIIEWSSLFPDYQPLDRINLTFKLLNSTERLLVFSATTATLTQLLQELKNDYIIY